MVLIDVSLNGQTLEAMLDTGSETTIVTAKGARILGLSNETIQNGDKYAAITPDGRNANVFARNFERLDVGELHWLRPKLDVQPTTDMDIFERRALNLRSVGVQEQTRREYLEKLSPPVILGLDFLEHHKIWISLATSQMFVTTNQPSAAAP